MTESAFIFECAGEPLVGVLSVPRDSRRVGVVVIVGGPQYRVGSHRQFVLLARELARAGFPCLRFDYRGIGDSGGGQRTFEQVDADVRAAVDEFHRRVPELDGVVLWGLCDGASAACFYAPTDARVRGLVLLNPWVRTAAGEARAYMRHYYLRRLLNPAFWKKLLRGGVGVVGSVRDLAHKAAASGGRIDDDRDLPTRMASALQRWQGPVAVMLSGRDYTAREFEQALDGHAGWRGLVRGERPIELIRFSDADHTFSRREWRDGVARATCDWLGRLSGSSGGT